MVTGEDTQATASITSNIQQEKANNNKRKLLRVSSKE